MGEATFDSFIFALAHLKSVSVMETRGFTSSICAVSRCRACMHAGGCCCSAPRRCMERSAAVQIPFFVCEDNLQLGNRAFYVPPSPVIGCHWSCVRGGKRLHGSFPDFPGHFFPLPFSPPTALPLYMASKSTRRSALP